MEAGYIPLLLAQYRAPSGDVIESAPQAAGESDTSQRLRVLSNLITKYLKLDDSAAALQLVLRNTTDAGEYDDASLALAGTLGEQSLCKARYDAIDANGPFSDPGTAAEDALLAAIRAVDRATANTSAVAALLNAAHALIAAYPANSTK